ncbi:MAG TPA: Crp/Fnr family transcriptional regulator [Bacteroidales bacterium]|jgi:CRP/FNR family transcriptional regulator|nr:Crp/Fnr family transcriptional regulator [Bacteroidales bacterium]
MEKLELLKRTFPFFERELLNELAESSSFTELLPGQSMLGEGDYIKSFPLVISGCLRVTKLSAGGNELLLYYLNQGEICAMSLTCCMGIRKSNIKMVAEDPSLILTVPVDKPEKWMSEYRTWKEFMMYSYRKRFEELLDTIESIAFMKLDERLIRFFEDRYRSTGKSYFSGTHQDIASQLNSSREVISRLLGNLEKKNLVVTERNSIDYSGLVKNSFAL